MGLVVGRSPIVEAAGRLVPIQRDRWTQYGMRATPRFAYLLQYQ
eukprot:COSAG02_NODE_15876_length_1134_cov_1.316908_1_plen_43_part_10